MAFRFQWYDENQRVMQIIAEGDWNWRDYHAAARIASFRIANAPHTVDTLIDFRQSERTKKPGGLSAHASSFGKKQMPPMSGDAVVLGLPPDWQATLPLDEDKSLATKDGRVYFAQSEEEAQAILQRLHAARQSS